MSSSPLVTVRCITYNHAPFIRQCLDGFVMQKTHFPFECIVHDDASTDGTADIIREYAAQYPNIIKPIFQTENQYSKRDGTIKRLMDAETRGQYIALCEGDDYWTSPDKLQIQVDFLESHPDCSMCFHNATLIYDKESDRDGNVNMFDRLEEREFAGKEIYETWMMPTASVMYRRESMPIPSDKRFLYGDIVLFLHLASLGKLYCIDQKMSVYRRHAGGVTMRPTKVKALLDHHFAVVEYFGAVYADYAYALIGENIGRSFYKREDKELYPLVFKDWRLFKSFVRTFLAMHYRAMKKRLGVA